MRKVTLPYDGEVEVYDWQEGAKIIRDAGRKSKKYYKGHGELRRTYCGTVGCFDIETSKVLNSKWDKKKSEMLHYFSFPYCWQFMIEGKFIFGQDPAEFFMMLKRARSTHGIVIIYIHNIVYEYNNLADFFLQNLNEVEIFWKNTATPLYIRYRNFEFRCSALLTHKSLAQLGDEIEYRKLKGDLDYAIPRGFKEGANLSPEELNYCFRDVAILEKWLKHECINYTGRTDYSSLPFTLTGYARKAIKEAWSLTTVGRQILEECRLPEYLYRILHDAFYGGFTHENIRKVAEILHEPLHVDIKSSYPAQMVLNGFPRALNCYTTTPEATKACFFNFLDSPKMACIARVRFHGLKLKKGGIPYVPYNENERKYDGQGVIEEGGKVFYAQHFEMTICDVDARIILDAYDYDDLEVTDLYAGVKKPLPEPVIETVLRFFADKSQYKGIEGKEYEYALAKVILNSLYGMAASGCIQPEYELDGLGTTEKVYKQDVYDDAGELIHKAGQIVYNYEPSKVLPYQWCIYITAYAREELYGMICRLEDKSDFYYCDTDSIFCKDTPANRQAIADYNAGVIERLESLKEKFPNIVPCTPKGEPQYLGIFEEEKDDCSEFCTIGPKRYYIQHPDGTVDVTVSGLRGTKRVKDENGVWQNGYNTQRLIDRFGSIHAAFVAISKNEKKDREKLVLEYVEGVDKLSNYNTRYDYEGELCGQIVCRPCSFTLYPVPTSLAMNESVRQMIAAVMLHDIKYEVVYNEIW